jgi:DNA helicase HerA-like ATPase
MSNLFDDVMKAGYAPLPNSICLGGILGPEGEIAELNLNISLKSLNRHGLIAGATGTGKTKTIQMLAEQLSKEGIPSLLMDIKGDLSGLAMAGDLNEKVLKRQQQLALPFEPKAFPVELLSMAEEPGIAVRFTLIEFGSILLAKMLGINETQTSILSILFQYAEDNQLLLLDLSDLKQLLNYAQNEGKKEIESNYGGISSASLRAILRSVIELESQGGDALFGEPSFDVCDFLQRDNQGRGLIFILRLMNMQSKTKLFSSFMLGLLNAVYSTFPEIGDPDKPKLVLFIDEAHLIFSNASKALLNQLENTVKLIRSKGVGLIFCTQSPDDIPQNILGQLGLKIQHALRAFTAKDRKAIKLSAENFPISSYYDTVNLLTSLSIGKALVTSLDNSGQPTPLVAAMIRAPESRMGTLSKGEILDCVSHSALVQKYHNRLNRESAMEVLKKRHLQQQKQEALPKIKKKQTKEVSAMETLSKNTLFRQVIRTITREVTRALMKMFRISKK